MFKMTDPFSYYISDTLKDGSTEVGTFMAKFQVTYDENVSLSSGTVATGSAANKRVYIVSCTQKVTRNNPAGLEYKFGASGSPAKATAIYNNYPVMLENTLTLATSIDSVNATSQLVDYSPQTVNSQVQSSNNVSNTTSDQTEATNSSTIGSSQAQSNSYNTNVGLQGNTFAMNVGHDRSATTSSDGNSTLGSSSGHSGSEDDSSSASMSIKDWGAYASIDPKTNSPTWIFGQEYPWDIFAGRAPWLTGGETTKNPNNDKQKLVLLPAYMTDRLYDAIKVASSNYEYTTLPPSQLSMFGYDFVMKAQWVITIPNGESDSVNITHIMKGATASHAYDNTVTPSGAHVYVDDNPTEYVLSGGKLDVDLDLGTMALEPVGTQNIVGFIPSNFFSPPAPVAKAGVAPTSPFVIFSNSNTMLIKDTTPYDKEPCAVGAGFKASQTSLNAEVVPNNPLTFTVLFKVTDVTNDYSLHFKHWTTTSEAVQLSIVINGDTDNKLVKIVDAIEGEGAENNLLNLTLRNQDFASVNYCDTLVLGLNSIDITLTPAGDSTANYALRAIAIQPN